MNLNSIKVQFKQMNLLDILMIMYFTIGAFNISSVYYLDSVILMIIHITTIYYIYKNKDKDKDNNIFKIYIALIVLLICIFISLIIIKSSAILILIRIMRIFSFVQIFLLYSMKKKYINYNLIFKNVINIYLIIGFFVILDAILFLIFKVSVWPVENYIGYRFQGPFFDSNYLGAFYAIMLLISIYTEKNSLDFDKKLYIIIFFVNMILSLSWSVIGFTLITIGIHKFLKFNKLFEKNLLIVIIYILTLMIVFYNLDTFKELFIGLLQNIMNLSYESAHMKYISIYHRINIQGNIIQLMSDNLFGLGPKQVIELFGRDSHNAYISFLGEMGIVGLLIYMVPFKLRLKKYNRLLDVVTTFIILQALFFNLLLTPIYWFVIFMIIYKYKESS